MKFVLDVLELPVVLVLVVVVSTNRWSAGSTIHRDRVTEVVPRVLEFRATVTLICSSPVDGPVCD